MLLFMLNTLFEVAKADGTLHPNEAVLLEKAKNIFRISDNDFNNLKTKYFPEADSDRHYAVLNCSSNDSDETIKSNYRKLVQEFHPDKIANKGLPEEFNLYAKTKFQEIQEAVNISPKDAELLQIVEIKPVISTAMIAYSSEHRPLLYENTIFEQSITKKSRM